MNMTAGVIGLGSMGMGAAVSLVRAGITTLGLDLREEARAYAVWARKFGRTPADAAERSRQMRFMASRGFSGPSVQGVMRRAQDEAPPGDAGASASHHDFGDH